MRADPVIDLVCWDFGDTLVDQDFMRIAPEGVERWKEVYNQVLAARPQWVEEWNLGTVPMSDLVQPLSAELGMEPMAVSRHLRLVWSQIVWYDDASQLVNRLRGVVPQAVVTVNPHEFSGIARACGLDSLVDLIVTSADLRSLSKVVMARHARTVLGLDADLRGTVLIDDRLDNLAEFADAGGRTVHYRPDAGCLDPLTAELFDR